MRHLFIAIVAVSAAMAQEAPQPGQCPAGPLVKPMPETIDWVITTKVLAKSGEADKVAGGAVTNAATVSGAGGAQASGTGTTPLDLGVDGSSSGRRVGEKWHVISTFGNGLRLESWAKSDAQVLYSSQRDEPEIYGPPNENLYGSIGWVSPQTFQGIRNIDGKDCMFFAAEIEDPSVDREFHAPKVKATALVELERRLPLAMRIGGTTTTYTFTPVPAGQTIVFPPEVEARFKLSDKISEERTKSVQRP